jgi:tetratricopeptide (TPR) repeat protein
MHNRKLAAILLIASLGGAAEIPPEYDEYSPEWFYGLAFVDASNNIARRGMEKFFQRDWDGAAGLSVGSGVRIADQALAQGAVEMARAADFAIDGKEDSAKAGFLRCADKASQAIVMAEDVPQVLRSTVLKARCLAVVPDRAAAAAVLSGSARKMDDKNDAAEFWYGAGRLQEDMGRFDSALALYQASWKAHERGEFAMLSLHSQGLMLAKLGRYQDVFPLVELADRKFSSDTRLRSKMRILEGRAWIALGDTARALFRWKTLTNAFTKGSGDLVPDSVEAAEIYWRLGDHSAQKAAQLRFDALDMESRKASHALRRELMEESFGYFRQAVACYAYPWTPVALRDIAGVIEQYANDVATQRIDFHNDTDRVAQEIVVQRKLPGLFQSAGNTYRRQIKLAQTSGDGIGIGLQSGSGLARSWWHAVVARRTAAELLHASPRPFADTTGLKWYESVVDSAVQVELETGRRSASEGLSDLSQWGQLNWPEADSLKVFVGPKASEEAIAKGAAKRVPSNQNSVAGEVPLTALQWTWRAYEARRQARMAVMDVRLLKARRDGK